MKATKRYLNIVIGIIPFFICVLEAQQLPNTMENPSAELFLSSEKSQWLASSLPLRGVALVIHGLNNKPSIMNEMTQSLQEKGVSVFRLALSGHNGSSESMKNVTPERWQNDALTGLLSASAEAKTRKVPLYVLGYSLGALTSLNAMASIHTNNENNVKVAHFFLFAPAIATRLSVSLLSLLAPFPELLIPSANDHQYRATTGTSIAAYNALRSHILGFTKSLDSGYFANTNATVFMRHHDEAVSFGKVKAIASRLAHWNFVELDDAKQPGYFRHLIVDKRTLGLANWNIVMSHLDNHVAQRFSNKP